MGRCRTYAHPPTRTARHRRERREPECGDDRRPAPPRSRTRRPACRLPRPAQLTRAQAPHHGNARPSAPAPLRPGSGGPSDVPETAAPSSGRPPEPHPVAGLPTLPSGPARESARPMPQRSPDTRHRPRPSPARPTAPQDPRAPGPPRRGDAATAKPGPHRSPTRHPAYRHPAAAPSGRPRESARPAPRERRPPGTTEHPPGHPDPRPPPRPAPGTAPPHPRPPAPGHRPTATGQRPPAPERPYAWHRPAPARPGPACRVVTCCYRHLT